MRMVHMVEIYTHNDGWKPVRCAYPGDETPTPERELVWFQDIFPRNQFRITKYVPEEKK